MPKRDSFGELTVDGSRIYALPLESGSCVSLNDALECLPKVVLKIFYFLDSNTQSNKTWVGLRVRRNAMLNQGFYATKASRRLPYR